MTWNFRKYIFFLSTQNRLTFHLLTELSPFPHFLNLVESAHLSTNVSQSAQKRSIYPNKECINSLEGPFILRHCREQIKHINTPGVTKKGRRKKPYRVLNSDVRMTGCY